MTTSATETDIESSPRTEPSQAKAGASVPLAMTFEELLRGDDSPEESADDIIQAIRVWRDAPSERGIL